ncbi:MAG: glycosyltransferase [Syntrophomonadaceae bacterium]|nr:glycosyltransferase [Syntrophomonadaceae bacterium]MDD3889302.1 glycosyltransferase [Syntrophomonadaceae bacterium]MDD4549863.1 glycosyltransferase [Syntrophomonadaceae bacterium]
MSNISCILYPPTVEFNYLVQRPQQLMKSFSLLNVPVFYLNLVKYMADKQNIEKFNPYLYIFNNVDPRPYLHNVKPVVYYSATSHVEVVKKYKPSLIVFDSVDEPSEEFAQWRPHYHQAVSTADVVLATSDSLYDAAREINPHTYLVPNGCDYDFFSLAASKSLPVPDDMKNISAPIIGYFGALASWCDLELIEQIADQHPDWSIVLIGPLYNISTVPSRPNIHWLGFKPYNSLASYAQLFDVGIIPFRQSTMTESVNPIKMWEYMATGMPIVATAIPEVKKYEELLYPAENGAEFIQKIQQALVEDTPEKRSQRMEFARNNSWSNRARQIIEIIETRLVEKGYINRSSVLPLAEALPYNPGIHYPFPSRVLKVSKNSFSYSTGKVVVPFKKSDFPSTQQTVREVRVSDRLPYKISTGRVR